MFSFQVLCIKVTGNEKAIHSKLTNDESIWLNLKSLG